MDATDAAAMRAEAERLRGELRAWCDAFEAREGFSPKRPEIFKDAGAHRLFIEARKLEKEAAGAPQPGACNYFVWRKKRYCSKRAAGEGERFCSAHQAIPHERLDGTRPGSDPAAAGAGGGGGGSAGGGGVGPGGKRGRGAGEPPETTGEDATKRRKTNLARRLKRMTNPLSRHHRERAVAVPDWSKVYRDTDAPLLMDVGCARGRFVRRLAQGEGALEGYNYLGIELYEPIVEQALAWRDAHIPCPGNLHYIAGPADRALAKLGPTLPNLQVVTIQFSDPWGERHANRRMVDASFAAAVAALLPPGGRVYVSSDHEDLATSTRDRLLATGAFEVRDAPGRGQGLDADGWLRGANPFGVPTERDEVCEDSWKRVWRLLLVRRAADAAPP